MIRLSEGLAKLYGTEEVLIRHVTEAAYLLKTSIVHIEQEAVTFEEDETETLLQTNDIAQMDLDDHSTNNQEDLIQVCLHYF
jgi:DNA replicative helicase MCM subunit Mcm2 (Cdc46/Mcm family)